MTASPSVPCCDLCDPGLLDRARPGDKLPNEKKRTVKRGEPAHDFRGKLELWREEMYMRYHARAQFDHTALLSDAHIDHLISVGRMNRAKLHAILGNSWVWWDRYADRLMAYMTGWEIPYIPKPRAGRAKRPRSASPSDFHPHSPRRSATRSGFSQGSARPPVYVLQIYADDTLRRFLPCQMEHP